jgi:uncharacterized protein YfiM (DUF2279 family)
LPCWMRCTRTTQAGRSRWRMSVWMFRLATDATRGYLASSCAGLAWSIKAVTKQRWRPIRS